VTVRTVSIRTASAFYDVAVGAGLLAGLGQRAAAIAPTARRVALIYDASLPESLVAATARSLDRLTVIQIPLHAAEQSKSIQTWAELLSEIARHRLERSDLVLALGGGIVGDVAGFAAAAYRRGLAIIQCPTTLLAMVDASVGGKTGVNLALDGRLLKNAVGVFHQPAQVVADVNALRSLPRVHVASGLAECIKHAMIAGPFGQPDLGAWLDDHASGIAALDPGTLVELVARNVALKGAVVGTDEREQAAGAAGRALLNLGHTFAHAIEVLPGLGLTHGQAVGLGLVCAASYAESSGACDPGAGVLRTLLHRLAWAGLPATVRGLPDSASVLEAMRDDKKSDGGALRLVVPTGLASAEVRRNPDEALIRLAIDRIRA
jgi:3-dehydroquinate synthetase